MNRDDSSDGDDDDVTTSSARSPSQSERTSNQTGSQSPPAGRSVNSLVIGSTPTSLRRGSAQQFSDFPEAEQAVDGESVTTISRTGTLCFKLLYWIDAPFVSTTLWCDSMPVRNTLNAIGDS